MIMYMFLAVLTLLFLGILCVYLYLDFEWDINIIIREPYANGYRVITDWAKIVKEPLRDERGKKIKGSRGKEYLKTLFSKIKILLPKNECFEIRKRSLLSFWKTRFIELVKEGETYVPVKFKHESKFYESVPINSLEEIHNTIYNARKVTTAPKKVNLGSLAQQFLPLATVGICAFMIIMTLESVKEMQATGAEAPSWYKDLMQSKDDLYNSMGEMYDDIDSNTEILDLNNMVANTGG